MHALLLGSLLLLVCLDQFCCIHNSTHRATTGMPAGCAFALPAPPARRRAAARRPRALPSSCCILLQQRAAARPRAPAAAARCCWAARPAHAGRSGRRRWLRWCQQAGSGRHACSSLMMRPAASRQPAPAAFSIARRPGGGEARRRHAKRAGGSAERAKDHHIHQHPGAIILVRAARRRQAPPSRSHLLLQRGDHPPRGRERLPGPRADVRLSQLCVSNAVKERAG